MIDAPTQAAWPIPLVVNWLFELGVEVQTHRIERSCFQTNPSGILLSSGENPWLLGGKWWN